MKKSRRTYNGVHLNKKSNTQDVVEQSLTVNSANVGIKFRTGVPFFVENHCNLNNIFYFHSSKHFPFGNKPINGSVFANISFSF